MIDFQLSFLSQVVIKLDNNLRKKWNIIYLISTSYIKIFLCFEQVGTFRNQFGTGKNLVYPEIF